MKINKAFSFSGQALNLAFERIEWAESAALSQFDFLPADGELVRLLASGALRVP